MQEMAGHGVTVLGHTHKHLWTGAYISEAGIPQPAHMQVRWAPAAENKM
jgi:hypothetical protein